MEDKKEVASGRRKLFSGEDKGERKVYARSFIAFFSWPLCEQNIFPPDTNTSTSASAHRLAAFPFEWKFDGKYASISGERRRLTIAGRDDRRQRRDERIFIHKLGDFTQSESHNLTISITFLNRTVERFRAEYQLKVQNIVHDVNRRGFTFLSRLSALFWFCCVATRDSACTNTRKDIRSSGTFRTSLYFLISDISQMKFIYEFRLSNVNFCISRFTDLDTQKRHPKWNRRNCRFFWDLLHYEGRERRIDDKGVSKNRFS